MAGWRRERRRLPEHLIAAAAANPGGSVAEIDRSVVSDPDGYVPAEVIIGFYLIGPDGRATGEFVHNLSFGPVRDDFARLESPDRWLPEPAGRRFGLSFRTCWPVRCPDRRLIGSRLSMSLRI
jgi:hypothetical protein